jgi:hypothetical protein
MFGDVPILMLVSRSRYIRTAAKGATERQKAMQREEERRSRKAAKSAAKKGR